MRHCVAEVLRPLFGAETLKEMDDILRRLPPVKLAVLYGIARVAIAVEEEGKEIGDELMDVFAAYIRKP